MGLNQSNTKNPTTAERLWVVESAKKGIQAIGWTLISPFVVIACPIIGAYEFGSRLQEELLTGSYVVDGTIGFLFGVVASPLAPFFVMWQSMEALFGRPPPLRPSIEYREQAFQKIGLDSDNYYNVAIIGCPGTGKSTLLNGLLGYRDTHKDAAQVRETNTSNHHQRNNNNNNNNVITPEVNGLPYSSFKSRGYKHPLLRSLMLWDMPSVVIHDGMRTKHYFHEYFLGAFDALLIVSAERLMATDVKLARRAIEYDVPVFFIRNKADAVCL
ncbi:hypothetical protein BDA99DRAFT_530260 [Phascolomyces articulosus]|uniref:IRG-type G domain-containing protein n=1 Tax=Phascolomyces articulosus TaxID=60185 RepID=A0AAD5JL86_9FUNG|nr:hypothetical protein BDA99DRAFT_530260 [Phascolomyces articulosus]